MAVFNRLWGVVASSSASSWSGAAVVVFAACAAMSRPLRAAWPEHLPPQRRRAIRRAGVPIRRGIETRARQWANFSSRTARRVRWRVWSTAAQRTRQQAIASSPLSRRNGLAWPCDSANRPAGRYRPRAGRISATLCGVPQQCDVVLLVKPTPRFFISLGQPLCPAMERGLFPGIGGLVIHRGDERRPGGG